MCFQRDSTFNDDLNGDGEEYKEWRRKFHGEKDRIKKVKKAGIGRKERKGGSEEKGSVKRLTDFRSLEKILSHCWLFFLPLSLSLFLNSQTVKLITNKILTEIVISTFAFLQEAALTHQ